MTIEVADDGRVVVASTDVSFAGLMLGLRCGEVPGDALLVADALHGEVSEWW